MDTSTITSQLREIKPESVNSFDSHLSPHIQTGNYGENYLVSLLQESGYIARRQRGLRFCGDIVCIDRRTGEIFAIEVKTANYIGNRFKFCLRKTGKTDCTYSDYVALLCLDQNANHYLYMVQSSLFGGVSMCTISSHPTVYKGKLAPFLVRDAVNFDDIRVTEMLWSLA